MSDPNPPVKPVKRRRLWLYLLVSVFFIALTVFGYYGYQVYQAMNQAYEPPTREKSEKRDSKVKITEDPVSILLLGVDERKNDKGRSDTMIVMTINPRQQTVKMMNIPRDTYTVIPGRAGYDKINHAYAFGGTELAITSVEEFLDIPIDHYAKVNMKGFSRIIDELGGVEVDVPFDFEFQDYHFQQGPMLLDGDAAFRFTQMRKDDPRGDLGRNERQQQVIKGILKKGTSASSWSKWDDVLGQIGENVTTDISPVDLLQLQGIYKQLGNKKIETLTIEGENKRIDRIFYYVVSDEEKARIQLELREHLELPAEKTHAGR